MAFPTQHRLTQGHVGMMWLLAPRSPSFGKFSLFFFNQGFLATGDLETSSCCMPGPGHNPIKQDMEEDGTGG